MSAEEEDAYILRLLRDAATARWKTARAILDAYAANAMPQPATEEELQRWQLDLEDAANEIARLSN